MVHIKSFTFNPFQENTYVLYDDSNEGIVIDPGCYEREEKEELKDFILSEKISVKLLLNTHCHVDHVLGNKFVKEYFKVPFLIHQIEESVLRSVKAYGPAYGFNNYEETEPDSFISENDVIKFGNTELSILFVPGHAPGHIAFYSSKHSFCIAGDVLFYRSIGRYDLPGGDYDTLINSIHTKLFTLPENTIIYPGHGPTTTIKDEKKLNPFCAI